MNLTPADVEVTGPAVWWAGPLDVEALAVGSVTVAADTANRLAAARDMTWRAAVDTSAVAHAFDSLRHLRVDGRSPVGFAPLSRFFPTSDGWIRLHGNYPHHRTAVLRALGIDADEVAGPALAAMTSAEAETAVTGAGGVAAVLRTPATWAAHPQGRVVAEGPLVAVERTDTPLELWPSEEGPLSGLRVLDLTRVVAGPACTRLLGLLGADVLRIDPPQSPELTFQHLDMNWGKRSAVADLDDWTVAERVHGLLDEVDVLVTGYRPGALKRFGLEAADVRDRHPHLVHGRLSAWGHDGPWAGARGFDSIVQVATGIAQRYGAEHDGSDGGPAGWRPGALPVQALDHATGYLLAAAVMDLLVGGTAGTVTVSLARVATWLLATDAPDPAAGQELVPPVLRRVSSTAGTLTYVAPPFLVDGKPLEYAWAPTRYGASALTWRSRQRWTGCGGKGKRVGG